MTASTLWIFLQHIGDPPKLLLNDKGGLDLIASSPCTLTQLCALLNKEWRPRDSAELPAASRVKTYPKSDDVEKLLQSGELDQVTRGVSMVSEAPSPEGPVLTALCEVAAGRCVPPQLRVRCLRTLWDAMNGFDASALRQIAAARDAAGVQQDKMSAYGLIVRCLSLKETLNTPEAVTCCSQILAALNLFVLLRHVTGHAEAVAKQDAADEDSPAPTDSGMSTASSVSATRADKLLCQLHGARQCVTDLVAANTRVGIEKRIRVATKPTRGVMGWLSTSSQSKLPRVVVHALLANDWISTAAVLLTSPSMTRNCAAHHALSSVVRSLVCQLLRHRQGVLVFATRSAATSRLVAALKRGRGHAHGGACLQWCISAAYPRASGVDVARVLEAYTQAMAAVLMLKQPHVAHHNPGPLSSSHMGALQHLSQLMVTAAGRDAVATVVSWFALADLLRVLQASWHPRGVVPQHAVDILLCAVRDAREEVVWCRILRDGVGGEGEGSVSDGGKDEDKDEDKGGSGGAEADVSGSAGKIKHAVKTESEGLLKSVLTLLDGAAKPGGTQRTSRTLLQALNTCCLRPA